MIIFRVEDKNGNGYKEELDREISNNTDEGFYGKYINKEDIYWKLRPMPENDGINIDLIKDHHFFGFKTIEQLNSWFTPADLVMGSYLNGVIAIYEVNEELIIFGLNQVAFYKDKAKLIKKVPMSYYLEEDVKNNLFDFKKIREENNLLSMKKHPELDFLENI